MKNLFESLKGVHFQVKIIDLGGLRLVVKEYGREPGVLKWAFIKASTLPFQMYPFETSPFNRLTREVKAFKSLRGFMTPRVILVDYRDILLVREFVNGSNDSQILDQHVEELGLALSIVHNQGFSLGDSKVDNIVFNPETEKWFIIDGEQVVESATPQTMIWDLLLFLSSYLLLTIERSPRRLLDFRRRMLLFLNSYLENIGARKDLSNAARTSQVKLISSLMLPYPYSRVFLETIRASSS